MHSKDKIVIIGSSCDAAKIIINSLVNNYLIIGVSRKGYEIKSDNYTNIKKDVAELSEFEIKGCKILINFAFDRYNKQNNFKISQIIRSLQKKIKFKSILISTILAKNKVLSNYAKIKKSQEIFFDKTIYLSTIKSEPPISADKEIINFFQKLKPFRFFFVYGNINLKMISSENFVRLFNLFINERIEDSIFKDNEISLNEYLKNNLYYNRFYIPIFIPVNFFKFVIIKFNLNLKTGIFQKMTNLFFS